jgi:hypothetical protein
MDEIVRGFRPNSWNHFHPDAPGCAFTFLNRHDDQCCFPPFELAATTDSGLGSANPGIVDLDLPMKLLSGHIYHGSAKLVEHHPRSFIATKTELMLEKCGRQATLIGRHKVRCPEPKGKRRFCIVKNRPGCQ